MSLTYEGVGDVGPVDAALKFQLVVGLDIEKQMLVEADPSDQVRPVGTLQGAPAVDVLDGGKAQGLLSHELTGLFPSLTPVLSPGTELGFLALELRPHALHSRVTPHPQIHLSSSRLGGGPPAKPNFIGPLPPSCLLPVVPLPPTVSWSPFPAVSSVLSVPL